MTTLLQQLLNAAKISRLSQHASLSHCFIVQWSPITKMLIKEAKYFESIHVYFKEQLQMFQLTAFVTWIIY